MARVSWIGILIVVSIYISTGNIVAGVSGDIYRRLFANYEKEMRPSCGSPHPVEIRLQMRLRDIIKLDEAKQVLESNAWIHLNWEDCRLRWNRSIDTNDTIIVPPDNIWQPDITLYEDTNADVALSKRNLFGVVLTREGKISHRFPAVLQTICNVNVSHFPFDQQSCPMQFGLWVYDDSQVIITSDDQVDISFYQEGAQWKLEGINASPYVHKMNNRNFSAVVFTLNISRYSSFYKWTLIAPCILIYIMAAVAFILPPSCEEKVELQLTILLSLTVFLSFTTDTVPPNSNPMPNICIYYIVVMALTGVSCLMAVVSRTCHVISHQSAHLPATAHMSVQLPPTAHQSTHLPQTAQMQAHLR